MASQIKARLIYNKRVKGDYFHCALSAPKIAKEAHPGQFVNIRVTDGVAPLLRRPLSIHGVVKGLKIKIIYETLGKGTQILALKKPGEFLDVIGPLGNGFNYRSPKTNHLTPILIAGGIGVAPLVFLAEQLKNTKPLVLIGAKTKKEILCSREFKALGCEVKIATDDGSRGFKGKVTELLKHLLSAIGYRPSAIYSCGPHLMLKTIAQIARDYKIDAQFSLEEHMACGIGACLGCAVATKSGYKTVCQDGPVFSSEELIW